jgi:digeranylgeranylglycerophospholipid reductase
MTDRYDVVVAGAGPAGAQCARDLAARGHEVVVLETEPEDRFPRTSNKSTAGTFPEALASFGVPDAVVQHHTDSVVLESPTEHYVQRRTGAVMDFAEFKRFLVCDGRDDGATYWFDARVAGPVTEGGEVVGVRYDGDSEVRGEIVVDATGPAAPLARGLDVVDLEREHQAIGVEYEFEGVDVDHEGYADCRDAMMLRLDHDIAPGGYAWLFHTGADTAKVGLCYIQNESHRRYAADGLGIDDYLERWLDTDPRFSDAERIEGKRAHRGSAHIQPPGSMSTDRFMAIGDTVPTIDPLWGEGIHKCMASGRTAAVTADACLTGETDTSAAAMSTYDDLWHERVAPRVRSRLLLTRLLYRAPNDRYDRLLRDLRAADDDTLRRANAGEKLAMAKLVHLSDLPLLVRFARDRIAA